MTQADAKREELDMILQRKLHNLNTKIRRACVDGPTSDDLQAIERERDELEYILQQHTQATSILITLIEEHRGPWTLKWPDLASERRQQNLKRGEEVEEAVDKVRKFCTNVRKGLSSEEDKTLFQNIKTKFKKARGSLKLARRGLHNATNNAGEPLEVSGPSTHLILPLFRLDS